MENNQELQLRMTTYEAATMVYDNKVTRRMVAEIINDNAKTIENEYLVMKLPMPNGLTMSEVEVPTGQEFEIEMLVDAMKVTIPIKRLSPSEKEKIMAIAYYGGEMIAPNYSLNSEIYIQKKEAIYEEKKFIGDLMLD